MRQAKYSKLLGLQRKQVETLRALFEAGASCTELPSWVCAPANGAALAALVRAGLVSEKLRLTLPGLAVAASLPPRKRRRWLLAA